MESWEAFVSSMFVGMVITAIPAIFVMLTHRKKKSVLDDMLKNIVKEPEPEHRFNPVNPPGYLAGFVGGFTTSLPAPRESGELPEESPRVVGPMVGFRETLTDPMHVSAPYRMGRMISIDINGQRYNAPILEQNGTTITVGPTRPAHLPPITQDNCMHFWQNISPVLRNCSICGKREEFDTPVTGAAVYAGKSKVVCSEHDYGSPVKSRKTDNLLARYICKKCGHIKEVPIPKVAELRKSRTRSMILEDND